ncbi:MAG: hypothetical protein EON50_06830 [Acidovorax sp.]|nr:MAG: hypothetical protein EON50_06830 [Acidovorax sp.]
MNHRFQCQCAKVGGEVADTRSAIHAICYCRDCQAYAHHLGQSDAVLDALAGTEVVGTHARNVSFTRGTDQLACVSLSEGGLLRWYARCCNTPLANTGRDWRMPYVGLVHLCLRGGDAPLAPAFVPVQMHLETASAKGTPPRMGWSKVRALLGFMPGIVASRFSGSYRRTPFFTPTGAPVVAVRVLSAAERAQAMAAL